MAFLGPTWKNLLSDGGAGGSPNGSIFEFERAEEPENQQGKLGDV